MKKIQEIKQGLLELFFPPLCLRCKSLVALYHPILKLVCPSCIQTLRQISPAYVQCHILNRINPCYLDELWIAFEFGELIRKLVHCVKYQRMGHLGCRIGKLAANALKTKLAALPSDFVVIPIPLHPGREKERTYNQSERLARGLFTDHLTYLHLDLLKRCRPTSTQTRLDRKARTQNVGQAFELNGVNKIQGKVVLLVDDVITTGATLNECARLLRQNGAKKVIAIALASPVLAEGY